MTHPDATFAVLTAWSKNHERVHGFKARLVYDDYLPRGEIVVSAHRVRLSHATGADLAVSAAKQKPFWELP